MFKKTGAAVLITVFALLTLTGCWDKRELNELAIVMAMGVDKDVQTGEIHLAIQVIRPSALNRPQGGSQESPYDVVVSSGRTMFDAIKEANKKLDRKFFFSHLKVIVVGEKEARAGISDLLDYISRTHQIRHTTWLIVTRDEISRVVEVKHGIETVQASYMDGIIKTQNANLNVTVTDTIGFINKMSGEGSNPVAGVFATQSERSIAAPDNRPEWKQGLIFSGTAVFKKDKLVGYLNNGDTRGLNYLVNAKKSGCIYVPSLTEKNKYTGIELKKADVQINPVISKGKTTFNIQIKAEGNISEVNDATDVSDQKKLEMINREFKASIRRDVRSVLFKAQKVYKSDIVGFGRAYEEKYPSRWKRVKDQWTAYFPDEPFSIQVETEIKQTGLQLAPLEGK
ncbi:MULTISPECIES: Ger(x)C family spore germination protein [unclassified Sporolactobacillus]|uniref:Ger(x)C family spore germination protein n=1 Tax=unclassified Sporolactobacillus TaxID=2628533 RepID=UPI0023678F0C|nr:Ger(x)C family spore germination protein [Sporolactobacillus sp. CQH2019]MDD9150637.1 Ger(x)C family spore germination protein [Sporolactobacillus sp. CQH2019]